MYVITATNIADRKGPLALLVAKTTLQMAKEGELDPKRLSERVIRLHRLSPSI